MGLSAEEDIFNSLNNESMLQNTHFQRHTRGKQKLTEWAKGENQERTCIMSPLEIHELLVNQRYVRSNKPHILIITCRMKNKNNIFLTPEKEFYINFKEETDPIGPQIRTSIMKGRNEHKVPKYLSKNPICPWSHELQPKKL